jgi:hypothetical protein
LWDSPGGEHNLHSVNWKTVCSPIVRGGLGVKNLALFNKALLGKWLWRFGTEQDYLWKQVIASKYGIQRGGWCSEEARGSYGVSLWRYIRKNWGAFLNYISFKVGDGLRINFWHDNWGGDSALKCSFPEFFALARNKEALVSEYMDHSSPHTLWNFNFMQDVHDWEIESLDSFLTLLYSMNPRSRATDSMVWTPSSRHSFAVKSYYTILSSPNIEEPGSFPWKSIWKVKVPPRIAFF